MGSNIFTIDQLIEAKNDGKQLPIPNKKKKDSHLLVMDYKLSD